MFQLTWLADHWTILVGDAVAALAAAYALAALIATVHWLARLSRRRRSIKSGPPVTVLKPLCGAEAGLYDSLRSCCEQDYSDFQIVFGVRTTADPAVQVVRRLEAEFPQLDIKLVVDERLIGGNYKISNLANMMAAVRHDVLVIADSDIRVGRDYLATVTAPLERPGVGLATCVYRARAASGFHARLSAMFVNGWFTPSVLVSRAFGWRAFGFGATLAMRRAVLDEIGGFEAVANHIADDYMLGEMVRRHGYETVLTDEMVETAAPDQRLPDLWRHELRQARALRVLQPVGYGFTFITAGIPLCGAMLALTGPQAFALAMLAVTVMSKWGLQIALCPDRGQAFRDAWLVPIRDLLSLAIWIWSHIGRRICWRSNYFVIRRDGSLVEVPPPALSAWKPANYMAAWFRLRNALFKNL
ncbi:MAG TPA: bacteriohopanetetrol glucosamine biosynthesis glycosyltransferase HpnI [Gammaproteobacteria bacterium]|nr:bacteriohopanetetrol glucosamine biosynthesis glycosyltransferase HpnI [Gammaproteobacteria bacterium]